MNKLKLALLIWVCFLAYFSYAQEDSGPSDTVVIVKEPIILRKQVIATSTPTSQTNNSNKWGLEAFFMGGKPMQNSSKFTQIASNPLFIGGLLITRNIKSFEVGVGILLAKGSFHYESSYTTSNNYNYDTTYTVLLDSYIQNIGGKDTTVYISEQRDTTLTKTNYTATNTSGNPTYTYVQIPIGLGYKFNLWKERLHVIPRIQLIYGLLTNATTDGYDSPKSSTFSYSVQLNLSYALNSYLSVLVKGQWQSYFNQPYPPQTFQVFTYGAGIVVHF